MPFIVTRDPVAEPLYAIVPYFNPWRWTTRIKHTIRALKHFHDSGVIIIFVELAFNRREFAFSDLGLDGMIPECGPLGRDHRFRHRHLQLRTKDELWLKENAIKVGVGMALPYDWQQVCWLDSDIHFLRPNWVGETIHKLQHYAYLQMFSHARDLGPNGEMLPHDHPHADGVGWVEAYRRGVLPPPGSASYGARALIGPGVSAPVRVWPGLAWACTREAWDATEGVMDFAVWGGGDYHQAHCLIERREGLMRDDLHPNYQLLVNEWFMKCQRKIRRNVGVVEGSIVHAYHGRKTERGYNARHALIAKAGFDPLHHLTRDYQGLYQLYDDGSEAYIQLRDGMRALAKERNEDSPEIDLGVTRNNH